MQKIQTKRALAAILSDIANLPPFLPGSIRKGGVQRHRNKAGEMAEYKAAPRFHCRRNGQWVDKRFHESLWETMKELTLNYKKFKKLIAEFEEAALQENLPDKSKKLSKQALLLPRLSNTAAAERRKTSAGNLSD